MPTLFFFVVDRFLCCIGPRARAFSYSNLSLTFWFSYELVHVQIQQMLLTSNNFVNVLHKHDEKVHKFGE